MLVSFIQHLRHVSIACECCIHTTWVVKCMSWWSQFEHCTKRSTARLNEWIVEWSFNFNHHRSVDISHTLIAWYITWVMRLTCQNNMTNVYRHTLPRTFLCCCLTIQSDAQQWQHFRFNVEHENWQVLTKLDVWVTAGAICSNWYDWDNCGVQSPNGGCGKLFCWADSLRLGCVGE